PRTTYDEMQLFFPRQFDEFARLAGGECHRLFKQNVQAPFERGFGLRKMNIRSRSHDDRIKLFEREQFPHAGAGVFRAEVVGDAFRLGALAALHGDQFGMGMRLDCGNVGKRRPPARANHTDANGCHIQPLNGASNSRLSSTPKPGLFGSSVTLPLTGSGSPSSTAKMGWMASPLPTERYSAQGELVLAMTK